MRADIAKQPQFTSQHQAKREREEGASVAEVQVGKRWGQSARGLFFRRSCLLALLALPFSRCFALQGASCRTFHEQWRRGLGSRLDVLCKEPSLSIYLLIHSFIHCANRGVLSRLSFPDVVRNDGIDPDFHSSTFFLSFVYKSDYCGLRAFSILFKT